GVTYNIEAGKNLSAEGVRNALHTKENVANKQVSSTNDTADVLDASSSDDYYPSSKLAGKNFAALRSGKQDKIAAGTANDIVAYSGTAAGTFGTLPRVTTLATSTTSASDVKIPTEKAVVTALGGKASSSDVAAKQDKIAAGTANDILTKTTTDGVLGTLTKTTSIRTGSTIDTAPDDTRIPTEKAVADAVAVATSAINGLSFQSVLPLGTILMFDAAGWQDNKTLVGWYACTAANHGINTDIPNLESSFLVGAGTAIARGTSGGSNALTSALLPKHTHTIYTDKTKETDRSKDKELTGSIECAEQEQGHSGILSFSTEETYYGWTRGAKDNPKILIDATHEHTGSANNDNSTTTDTNTSNMPAYYAVIYIKRVS
ncbi:hypothetical protein NO1_1954, partial [Candidatus Termititenax aidoneus]